MLSIVETLREYRSMLYGCKELHVYTDHKNNTFQKLNTQRVIRWRMFLEDFGPKLHYIKGPDNVLADALSRLSFAERQTIPAGPSTPSLPSATDVADDIQPLSSSFFSMAIDDPTLAQCFANLPQSENIPFELTYARIAAAQGEDAHLEQLIKDHPENYQTRMLAPDVTVRCYVANPSSAPDDWKIYLPQSLMDSAIRWYHLALCHAGMNRVLTP